MYRGGVGNLKKGDYLRGKNEQKFKSVLSIRHYVTDSKGRGGGFFLCFFLLNIFVRGRRKKGLDNLVRRSGTNKAGVVGGRGKGRELRRREGGRYK